MKILFNIGHPAHIHLFKNLIWDLERHGHHCNITTIAKDVCLYLLEAYGFKYEVIGQSMPTLASKAIELVRIEARLYRIARSFRPDLLVGGSGNVYVAHVGKLIRKPSIVFDDTEHSKIEHFLMDPFVSAICTPSCYRGDLGPKQIRYNSYHSLASLHPNYFTPNPAVLTELGFDMSDNIFLIRFAAFDASHDTKSGHFDKRYIPDLINKLEDKGKIVISSEVKLGSDLQKYQYKFSPEKYHDLLYFSKMYIGEGSTSAIEAAILGVPSLHFESLNIGGQKSTILPYIGVLDELQTKYKLLYSFCDERDLLSKVDEILKDVDGAKMIWSQRRDTLLNDKIDATVFMVWFIENYPISFNQLKNNPALREKYQFSSREVV